MLLGVNIDHIATLREARRINDPDPLEAVFLAKRVGAFQITVHLREDRRHIHDEDLRRIVESSFLPVNVECAITPPMVSQISSLHPYRMTLVPEKREEVTTEGGLDLERHFAAIKEAVAEIHLRGIGSSLFIDPTLEAVERSKDLGAEMVELHTGSLANLHLMLYSNLSKTHHAIHELKLDRKELLAAYKSSLIDLQNAANRAKALGLEVAAGHGLNYHNVRDILSIGAISELNIGHSIIARSLFVGFERAVSEMVTLLRP